MQHQAALLYTLTFRSGFKKIVILYMFLLIYTQSTTSPHTNQSKR